MHDGSASNDVQHLPHVTAGQARDVGVERLLQPSGLSLQ